MRNSVFKKRWWTFRRSVDGRQSRSSFALKLN
ncbi:hypothetical protein D4764_0142750 [Takifugu flavidus]|uniref:Uncharacterized protein n=1 Tax=Takifugu flavidus TaxID=433684 RepID=A0A5C6MIG2_9TELE|nr:hypothetical protein D4764_0142750 [Takifugu flavidus]